MIDNYFSDLWVLEIKTEVDYIRLQNTGKRAGYIMEDVLVSVICLTYNHEKYVSDTIEGCLMQEVNFKYEILIHDDASTDGTVEIIKAYEEKYPDLIIGIYEEENQYSKGIHVTKIALKRSRGKYIALCEGDDYWTDRHKLQLQVDFMEKHLEYYMVAHGAKLINYMNGKESVIRCRTEDGEIPARDIIVQSYGNFPTASLLVRKEVCFTEAFLWNTGVGDWSYQISAITFGKVFYIDKEMSVYRHGVEGSWTQKNASNAPGSFKLIQYLKLIEMTDIYDRYTEYKFHEYILNRKAQFYLNVAIKYLYCDGYEKLYNYCNDIVKNEKKYEEYCKTIKNLCFGFINKTYCQEGLIRFTSQFENILIYGAGEYAGVLADLLDSNEIKYDGYIVTFLNEDFEYRGKKVWEIGYQPFDCNTTGILLGTSPNLYYTMQDNLKKNQMNHFYAPFLEIK